MNEDITAEGRKQRRDVTSAAAQPRTQAVTLASEAAVHRRATFLGLTQASEQELGDTPRALGDSRLTPTKARADGSHLLRWVSQYAGHSRNSSKAFCCLHPFPPPPPPLMILEKKKGKRGWDQASG